MQTRKQTGKPERAESEEEGEDEERDEKPVIDKRKQRPKTSALTDMPPLSDKQREKILMKNLLLSKPRLVESAPPARKRGKYRSELRRVISQVQVHVCLHTKLYMYCSSLPGA